MDYRKKKKNIKTKINFPVEREIMKKQIVAPEVSVEAPAKEVHPLMKSYKLVSKTHVDYDNLSAFEAVSMSAVFVLAVLVGVIQSNVIV